MKGLRVLVLTAVLVSALLGSVYAEEAKVTGSASVGAFNKYIFRGYEISRGSIVVQPAVTVNYSGFSIGMWSNIDSKERWTQSSMTSDWKSYTGNGGTQADPGQLGGSKNLNETDITLSYTYNISKLALTGGWIYYGTGYVRQTEELFLTAALDVISKPTLSVYRDIGHYAGTYANLSFAHTVNVTKAVTLDLGAAAGGYFAMTDAYWRTYNATPAGQATPLINGIATNYNGKKYQGLHDGMLKAAVNIPVGKFTIQPSVQYWFPLSHNASRLVADANGTPVSSRDSYRKFEYNPNGHLDPTVVYGLNVTLNF
ncbi:MAG: hypothetical protein HQL10_09155 [Nitrospirae bacterium]|nr:hypothetical protein [Nitrospirota bacterium]